MTVVSSRGSSFGVTVTYSGIVLNCSIVLIETLGVGIVKTFVSVIVEVTKILLVAWTISGEAVIVTSAGVRGSTKGDGIRPAVKEPPWPARRSK